MDRSSGPDREKAIFYTARHILDQAERNAYLADVCAEDTGLRHEVELLLAAEISAAEFLEGADRILEEEYVLADDSGLVGSSIGPYKLLEKIGEGGFGVVFMADQLDPTRRRVAIKVIKAGMDSKQVVARFEAERQALALMDHPGIAKVLDAGTTKAGRPFIAMELVCGTTVTKFCDDRCLSTKGRLRLFSKICSAVQHAHQKGVIHRDLKPSNILAFDDGEEPAVKVIDFGIAKATQGHLTDKTLFTNFRQLVGTPSYMSPEQAQMSGVDVDTRSDIYSLGVLLYELLTGKTPLDSEDLIEASYEEVCRRIREDTPPVPSRRVSSLVDGELATIAQNRQLEPCELASSMRGDLDWIVTRAVEKSRARRYRTVDAFADDIRRYLDGAPVAAVPPSLPYLASKFVARHRGLIFTASIVLSTLLVASIVSTVYALRANRANDLLSNEIVKKDHATRQAIRAQVELEKDNYFHKIARASREVLSNELSNAQTSLSACPKHLREWEWDYLNRQCHLESRKLSLRSAEPAGNYTDLQVSSDGKYLLTTQTLGSGKKKLHQFWDVESGERLSPLCPINDDVNAVAFSPDASRIAVGFTSPGGVAVWDVHSMEQLMHYRSPSLGTQQFVAFGPDSNRILTSSRMQNREASTSRDSSNDWFVHLWNVKEGKLERSLDGHKGTVFRAVLSPNGKRIASASYDGSVRVWDAASGRLDRRLNPGPDVRDVAFSPDNTHILSGGFLSGGGFWSESNLEDPDSQEAFFAVQEVSVRDVEYVTGPADVYMARKGESENVRHQQQVLIGVSEGMVYKVNRNTGLILEKIRAHDTTARMDLDGAKERLFTCEALTGEIKIWDLGREIRQWSDASFIRQDLAWAVDVQFHPSQKQIAIAGGRSLNRSHRTGKRDIQLWDISNLYRPQLLKRIGGDNGHLTSLAYNNVGNQIAAGSQDNIVRIWSVDSGEIVFQFKHEGEVSDVLFVKQGHAGNRNQERLVTACADNAIRVWNFKTETPQRLDGHEAAVTCIARSPDHNYLISGSNDKTVRIWNLATGNAESVLRTEEPVVSVDWATSGDHIAAGQDKGRVEMWTVADNTGPLTFERVHTIDLGRPRGAMVAFHPDGGRLAVFCQRLKLWDIESRQEAFSFPHRLARSLAVSFSPDGKQLMVARNTITLIWDATRLPKQDSTDPKGGDHE